MKAYFFAITVLVFTLSSCLTTTEKKIVEAPWKPSQQISNAATSNSPVGQIAPVYFSATEIPAIDGTFADWNGLAGVYARVMVFGGSYDEANTSGHFVLRTDGKTLFLFADILDNVPQTSTLAASQAWRADSIEFFFGTDTSLHSTYKNSDKRIRFVPRSKTNIFDVAYSINDVDMESGINAVIVFNEKGYKLEAAIPLQLLGTRELKLNQNVRLEFQINDADEKERTRLVHWMSAKDTTYMDASIWGDGRVVPLPKRITP